MRNSWLLLALVATSLSSFAQTQSRVANSSKVNPVQNSKQSSTPFQWMDMDAALKQAALDKQALVTKLKSDQELMTSDATCKILYDQAQIQYINWFESHASEIRSQIQNYRVQQQLPREQLLKKIHALNSFEVSVIITPEQVDGIKNGMISARTNSANSEILISLQDAIRFFDVFNQRIKSCEKSANAKMEMISVLQKSLNNPYSNSLGLTYDQAVIALDKLSSELNAKLKDDGINYELRFLDPQTQESCKAGIELIQKSILPFPSEKHYALKLIQNEVVLDGLEKSKPQVSEAKALIALVQNGAEIQDQGVSYSLDAYARWLNFLQSKIPSECESVLGYGKLKWGNSGSIYMNESLALQVQGHLLSGGSVFSSPQSPLIPAATQMFAISQEGSISTWGDAMIWNSLVPVQDSWLHEKPVKSIIAGYHHRLVLLEDGSVWGWGSNSHGQLGLGNIYDQIVPQEITAFRGKTVQSIVSGPISDSSYALLSDGSLWAWGANGYQDLGIGNTIQQTTPVEVVAMRGKKIKSIAVGGNHTLVLLKDGSLWMWGYNQNGQSGLGRSSQSIKPTEVTTFRGKQIESIAVGYNHCFAVLNDGTLWAWGENANGQLGIENTRDQYTPVLVNMFAGKRVISITAGFNHSLALLSDGSLWAWGAGGVGQLGLGSTENSAVPREIRSLGKTVKSVVAGYASSFAIMKDGSVWAWGRNAYGELGIGNKVNQFTPVEITALRSKLRK